MSEGLQEVDQSICERCVYCTGSQKLMTFPGVWCEPRPEKVIKWVRNPAALCPHFVPRQLAA